MAQKLHIGGQPHDMGLRQRGIHARQGFFTRGTVHDEFGHHGVVKRADGVTLAHARVHPRSVGGAFKRHMGGQAIDLQRAGGGQEVVVGVLGADARLNRVPLDSEFMLLQRQRLARCHAQLPLHQVLPGDGLGDWVLHLQARVHFHEEEGHAAIGLLLHDELYGSCTHILHSPRCGHGRLAHLLAEGFRHARRRRLFQHLLVAALYRAVALEQVDVVALRVAKHLDLDMARTLYILFNQHCVIAKAVDSLAFAAGQCCGKVLRLIHRAHALAAAACAGLDEHGVAYAVRLALQQPRVLVFAMVARHQGHARLFHQLLGLGFQPHGQNGRSRRADEHQPRLGAGLGELFVLAQKAIARVDGLGASGLGSINDGFPAQVTVFGRAATDKHRLITSGHVLGPGVGIGVHGHRFDRQAAGRCGNAASNFTAIGDEDFLKHGVSSGN